MEWRRKRWRPNIRESPNVSGNKSIGPADRQLPAGSLMLLHCEVEQCSKCCSRGCLRSVFGWNLFHVIDEEDFNRSLSRFHLQAQLFLKSRQNWGRRIRPAWIDAFRCPV